MTNIIALNRKNAYTTEVKCRDFTIINDEPLDKNGSNMGMTPMELLGASLASCTAITLRMYANRKEWQIDDIQVEVQIDSSSTDVSFNKMITLKNSSLTEDKKNQMLLISKKCPVHKILEKSVIINSYIQ